MRRLFLAALLSLMLWSNSGCALPMYDARPEERARQLLFTSEDLRMLLDEIERFWFLDMPSHMTPLQTHGGII